MEDTISRREAIDAIISQHGVVDKSVAKRILIQLPSAQRTIYGYSTEYLTMLAITMQRNNVTPQEANDIMKDIKRVVEMVNEEYEKMLNRSMESVFGKLGGANDDRPD